MVETEPPPSASHGGQPRTEGAPSGERLLKLGGIDAGRELAEVPPLEAALRLPAAGE